MENPERQLAIIKTDAIQVVSHYLNLDFDLYLTDKRMILIHNTTKSWGTSAGGAVGGMVGAILGSVLDYKRRKRLESKKNENEVSEPTLDELLARDKENFAISHENIEKIRLYKVRLHHKLDVSGKREGKEIGIFSQIDKEQYEQLSTLLPTIAALQGKLES